MKIKVGIIGVTGYTGGELLRLLINHPHVEIKKATSRSNSGNDVTQVHPHLDKEISLIEDEMDIEKFITGLDVVFLALPHGKSAPLVKEIYNKNVRVIDLGADFRLKNLDEYKAWYEVDHSCPELVSESVYGLPEIYKEKIKEKAIIANPGCYPTSVILGLAPLVAEKIINLDNIVIDSKSGITGAGKTLTQQTHYPDMNDNLLAYKVGSHRHTPEIEQELSILGNTNLKINFTPHLIPMNRGILSTIYTNANIALTTKELEKVYVEYYQDCPFIRLRNKNNLPQTKWVQGSNYCDIAAIFDERTERIIILSTIDNLVKGASGQAIQNMNLMFGLDETAGLKFPGLYP
jgi:N-acetyl-gamma-glutamyl-phosphate reductase